MGPAAQEGQDHDSKAEAVEVAERAVARTCLGEEACVGVALVVVDSLRPGEQNRMEEGRVAKWSHQAFATDTHMSNLSTVSQLRDAITPGALQDQRCY